MLFPVKSKISTCLPWLLVATFTVLPFNPKLANNIGLLVLVLWLIDGGLKEKWRQIFRDPLAWIPILYFLVLCCGLLWTSDLDWGLHIIKKSRRFLLILMSDAYLTLFYTGLLLALFMAIGREVEHVESAGEVHRV